MTNAQFVELLVYLKLIEKSEVDEMMYILYMSKRISPKGRLRVLQTVNAKFVELLAQSMPQSMSSKELTAWRDKNSACLNREQREQFDHAIVEKRRSEFVGTKGGRFVVKQEDGMLKGKCDL